MRKGEHMMNLDKMCFWHTILLSRYNNILITFSINITKGFHEQHLHFNLLIKEAGNI